MPDVISASLDAIARDRLSAFLLVFLAGVVSSGGPCAAPRLLAAAGLICGKTRSRAIRELAVFAAGVTTAYALFGAAGTMAWDVLRHSQEFYGAVAALLIVSGLWQLWRGSAAGHGCCGIAHGGTFLTGASLALVISPCCAPVVFAILAYTSSSGHALAASGLLAAFALGHLLPAVAAASISRAAVAMLTRNGIAAASTIAGAAITVAVGAYYAVLA
jgi:cytochrome c biogenesis protein CcdA